MADFIFSAFADEAGKTLTEQIDALKANGMTLLEPRGLDLGNVSAYTAEQCRAVREVLDEAGIGVSAIGSGYGKIRVTDDFAPHFEQFCQGVENAAVLGTDKIRMFSFYIPEGEAPETYRDEVFSRLEKMADYARAHGVWCCHENEKGIYGDNLERNLEILTAFEGKMRGVFDPANYIQCGVEPLPAYLKLAPYVEYMHVKDCLFANGTVVPPGKGDARLPEILKAYAENGGRVLTLEPHLKVFSGLDNLETVSGSVFSVGNTYVYPTNRAAFDAAASALREILAQ